jgi:hypothetical protein
MLIGGGLYLVAMVTIMVSPKVRDEAPVTQPVSAGVSA